MLHDFCVKSETIQSDTFKLFPVIVHLHIPKLSKSLYPEADNPVHRVGKRTRQPVTNG